MEEAAAAMSLDYVDMSVDDDAYDYDAMKVVSRMIQKEVVIMSLNDVPMSPVDDAYLDKVLGRVRKKDKVLPPLDDDDDTGRSIRKVTSLVDDNAYLKILIRKEREKVMSLNDDHHANLEKIERNNTLMSMDDPNLRMMFSLSYRDGDRGLGGGIIPTTKSVVQKTEIQNIISDEDLKLPLECFQILQYYLPAMTKTFRDKDLSLLRKYCFLTDSSSIENLSFEEALKHELVATCVWFLLTKDCPDNAKEGLASALRFIIFKGECVGDAQGKISVDQACIDTLVVDALISGHKEIIRQVCEAIFFVVDFSLADIGTGIQIQLVKLACSLPFSCDTCVGISLLTTINRISENEDGFMREELFKAVLSDRKWLLDIISGSNDQFVLEAYEILECLACGEYDDELWEVLLEDIIPAILERDGEPDVTLDPVRQFLVRSAIRIISNSINKATSVGSIGLLALDTNCLHALVGFLDVLGGGDADKWLCMEAIETILKTDEDESEDNMFALRIGEHQEYVHVYGGLGSEREMRVKGWDLLRNEAPNSDSILLKYAPKEWLRENMTYGNIFSLRGQEVY